MRPGWWLAPLVLVAVSCGTDEPATGDRTPAATVPSGASGDVPRPSSATADEPARRAEGDDESDWAEFAVDPLPAPDPADVAVPAPSPRVACPPATVEVGDAAALESALADAVPGDVIQLAPGPYAGNFVATVRAAADEPIFLCGPEDAVLQGEGPRESGYVLHLDGAAHWRLVGFTVRDGRKGVMVDGGVGNVVQGLTVTSIGDEAIHLRAFSTDNLVLDNTISDTGNRRAKFGEGIYVGSAESNWCEHSGCAPDRSDRNRVEGNRISDTTSEAIDIKEGTVDGVVIDNRFDGAGTTDADSWIDVKGNGWIVAGNIGTAAPEHGIQTHEIISGWGSGNVFVANDLTVDAGGYGFDLHGPDASNLVACDNDVSGADEGFSNELCR